MTKNEQKCQIFPFDDLTRFDTIKFFFFIHLGFGDGTGTSTDLASLTFWPNNELASGNFSQCTAGMIDVSTLGLI